MQFRIIIVLLLLLNLTVIKGNYSDFDLLTRESFY